MTALSDMTTPPNIESGKPSRISASTLESVISIFVGLWIAAMLYYGWVTRWSRTINPEEGIGYALGIIGGSMMLLLLVYPLRKRIKSLANFGSVGFWFRFHMLLGLMGPLAILYHCRFSWGALNSAVALGAMIVVASSGLIGRFFYSRVHRGYSGRKLELRSLKQEMDGLLEILAAGGLSHDAIRGRMQPFEDDAVAAGSSFWSSAWAVIGLGLRTRTAERRLRKSLSALPDERADGLRETAAHFFKAVRRAAEFAFYDRLLRLWHMLHLPLFILLVAAAVLHIVAVHMY